MKVTQTLSVKQDGAICERIEEGTLAAALLMPIKFPSTKQNEKRINVIMRVSINYRIEKIIYECRSLTC